MIDITDENIERIKREILEAAHGIEYSFMDPVDIREYAPSKNVVTLMRNDETGEEIYLPDRIESESGRVLYKFDHPGYTPAIKTSITIDIALDEKGDS